MLLTEGVIGSQNLFSKSRLDPFPDPGPRQPIFFNTASFKLFPFGYYVAGVAALNVLLHFRLLPLL